MSDKIIDLNPEIRLNKEALKAVQETVASFAIEDLDSLIVIYTQKNGHANFSAYGANWVLLGLAQAYLEELRAEMLCGSEIEED